MVKIYSHFGLDNIGGRTLARRKGLQEPSLGYQQIEQAERIRRYKAITKERN
jgi:hypothetical protein